MITVPIDLALAFSRIGCKFEAESIEPKLIAVGTNLLNSGNESVAVIWVEA